MPTNPGYRGLPLNPTQRDIAGVVNAMLIGGINIGGSLTLTASVTTTTVQDARVSGGSKILLFPTSDTAALQFGNGTLYVSTKAKGSFTVTQSDTADGTETFDYIAIG